MTWEEVHDEIIKRLLRNGYDIPHGCVPRNIQKQDPELYQQRSCVWICKAPKSHVVFREGVAEVSGWYDSFNCVKISLADPDFFEKIEKEVWQTDR